MLAIKNVESHRIYNIDSSDLQMQRAFLYSTVGDIGWASKNETSRAKQS